MKKCQLLVRALGLDRRILTSEITFLFLHKTMTAPQMSSGGSHEKGAQFLPLVQLIQYETAVTCLGAEDGDTSLPPQRSVVLT